MTNARLAGLVAIWASVPAAAHAHPVEYAPDVVQRDGLVSVRFRSLHHGAPLAGGWVQAFAPADPGKPRVEGRTDGTGLFEFRPDAPGTWRVRAVDATGHGATATVEIAPGPAAATASPPAPPAGAGESQPSGGSGGGPHGAAPRGRMFAVAAAIVLAFVALAAFHRRRPRA